MSQVDDIRLQVMWTRLISVVEEQARTLVRTAFSTSVREAGDLSAGVFDPDGAMLAQAVTGTPGHVNTMAEAVPHFIAAFPRERMAPGDTYVTNDSWKGTGHLHDVTMVTPSFRGGRLIGFFACTAHVVDIGGRGFGADGRSIYEEGLQIPIMKFAAAGELNETLLSILAANTREPEQVIGDFHSLAACNEVGHRRLCDMLDEVGLDNLEPLAAFIFSRTHDAMAERLGQLPVGTWTNEMTTDGYDSPIKLAARVEMTGQGVHVDFAGSSPPSAWGINVPLIYTKAYACYAIKCVVAPDIPNNSASLAAVSVSSPVNVVNAERPAPVSLRHVIGHMVPDLILGAMAQALPGEVPAEGAGALWNVHLSLRPTGEDGGDRAEVLMFNSGGTGARPAHDGLSATAFPSGVQTMPVEATEHAGPIVVWRKELRPDSGGDGRQRGGLGQVIELAPLDGYEIEFSAMFDRVGTPARDRDGGADGAPGHVALDDGTPLRPKGWQSLPRGRRLVLHLPGGGGFGDPADRRAADRREDARKGYVSAEWTDARVAPARDVEDQTAGGRPMTKPYRRILLTGAAGRLGSELRKELKSLADEVRLADREPIEDAQDHEEVRNFDLADAGATMDAVAGCDGVVHFGGAALESPWKTILGSSIEGSYHIYEGARKAGTRRIVYASSVHAIGYHGLADHIDTETPVRPDSLYGVSKCFVEALSSLYWDKFSIETANLRIFSSFPEPADRRMLWSWLSFADCRRLVRAALSAPHVGHSISFGMSDNAVKPVDNGKAGHLGYSPRDSAEPHREAVEARTDRPDPKDPAVTALGGWFVHLGHPDDPEAS